MTQNIEQRTLAATATMEGAAKSVDEIAHKDADVVTPVGIRKSFPKISREWDDESQRLQTQWQNNSANLTQDWQNERNELSTKALGVKPWESGVSETNINQQRRWDDGHTYLPKTVPAVMDAGGPNDDWIPYTADKSDTLNDVFGRKPVDLFQGVFLVPDERYQYPKLNALGKVWELANGEQQLEVKSFSETADEYLIVTLMDDTQVIAHKMEGASRNWVNEEVTGSSESETQTKQLVGTVADFNRGTRQVDGHNAIRLTDKKLLMVFQRRTYPDNETVPEQFTIKSIVDNVMTIDYGAGEKTVILEYNVWPVGDLRRYGGYLDAILPNNADNPSPTDDTNAWLYALHCLPDPAEVTVHGLSYTTAEIPLSKSLHITTPSLPTYYKRNGGISGSGWRRYGAAGVINTTTDTFDPKSKSVKQLAIILNAVTMIGGRTNTSFKTSDKSVEVDYFHVEATGVTFANFYRNLDGSLGSWLWKLKNCSFTDAAEWGCWMDAAHGAHVTGCDFAWENLKGLYIDQGQSAVVTGNHFPHNAKYQLIAVQIDRPQTMSFYDNYFETYSYASDPRPLVNDGLGTYPLVLALDHYTNSDKGRFTPNYFGLHTKRAIILKKVQPGFFSSSEMNLFGNDIKNVGGFSDFYALQVMLEGDASSNMLTMPFSGIESDSILDPNNQLRTFGNGAMWHGTNIFTDVNADKNLKIPGDFPEARNDKNVSFVGDNQIRPITTKTRAKIILSYTWENTTGDANFIIRMKSFQGNYQTKDVYCTGKGGSGTLEVYVKKGVLEYTRIDFIVSGETNVGPSSAQIELRVESLNV
ncbi:hypothetical protein FC650_20560 [Vibrio natriegens]|uniref:right-handed parallel beta-helix repeat-containing protein n=1 Tax=Vibrio natriegens TaxID=691 RepID=UPI001592E63B|nr:right-handed parallel beta-helix repeat-containing protein [Vibrio natriegens]NVC95953.1 hypothetical protein [Vibrio natriegens]